MGTRADLWLVERGLFESRAQAQEAIAAGLVSADGELVRKASKPLAANAEVTARAAHPWASRGGVKLAAALDAFALDPAGLYCLDVGASTGGFTDVLLERGARHVVALDVGHGQLCQRLRGDPRVTSLEGLDARKLDAAALAEAPGAIVCDVSFISQRLVAPAALAFAAADAFYIGLVKPQFEVGRENLVKGVVRDEKALRRACADVRACVETLGWRTLGLVESPILGGDGARELLYAARHG